MNHLSSAEAAPAAAPRIAARMAANPKFRSYDFSYLLDIILAYLAFVAGFHCCAQLHRNCAQLRTIAQPFEPSPAEPTPGPHRHPFPHPHRARQRWGPVSGADLIAAVAGLRSDTQVGSGRRPRSGPPSTTALGLTRGPGSALSPGASQVLR